MSTDEQILQEVQGGHNQVFPVDKSLSHPDVGRGVEEESHGAEKYWPEFLEYPKTPRLNRDVIITEKIDGTNAQIFIDDTGRIFAGSRSRWITPANDNYGFARWVEGNKTELLKLGPGRHFGEWWGAGIQRRYNQDRKRFSLFNVQRWSEVFAGEPGNELRPACCDVVPVFWRGPFDSTDVRIAIDRLKAEGSWAAPGFMRPEGIIVYHTAAQKPFKVLLENDEGRKGE